MSKQGLPTPGTSFLDYINKDGKRTNYFIDLSNNFSTEVVGNKKMSQDIYSHLCTIRMQDFVGSSIDKILLEIYFKAIKLDDRIKKSQITFMVYAIHFFTEAIIGSTRQNGVPYINIPIGIQTFLSFAHFCYIDFLEDKELTQKTIELSKITDEILKKSNEQSIQINHYDSSEEFLNMLNNTDNNMELLINFLGDDN